MNLHNGLCSTNGEKRHTDTHRTRNIVREQKMYFTRLITNFKKGEKERSFRG